jgi:hypothetical protein
MAYVTYVVDRDETGTAIAAAMTEAEARRVGTVRLLTHIGKLGTSGWLQTLERDLTESETATIDKILAEALEQ